MTSRKNWLAVGLVGLVAVTAVVSGSSTAQAAAPNTAASALEEKIAKLEAQVKELQKLVDLLRQQLASAASGSTSASPAAASASGGTRVAVVDLVNVFNDYEQTKVLNQKMSALEDELRNQDQRKAAEIDSQKNAIKQFAPDSAEYKKQTEDLKRLMIEYQVWKATEQDRVGQAHLRWVNRTYKKVEDQVAAIAKAKGFQLVITKEELDTTVDDSKVMLKQIIGRKVIYSEPSVDLTSEVLANLNAAFQKDGGAKSIDFNK